MFTVGALICCAALNKVMLLVGRVLIGFATGKYAKTPDPSSGSQVIWLGKDHYGFFKLNIFAAGNPTPKSCGSQFTFLSIIEKIVA